MVQTAHGHCGSATPSLVPHLHLQPQKESVIAPPLQPLQPSASANGCYRDSYYQTANSTNQQQQRSSQASDPRTADAHNWESQTAPQRQNDMAGYGPSSASLQPTCPVNWTGQELQLNRQNQQQLHSV